MPRKSDAGPIPGAGPPSGEKDANGVSIDENVLPKSIVTRLAKGVLPQNTNIQKDAVLALTKGATVFINYLCATANENAVKSSKKTIMPRDVLEAISQLELDDFRPRLEAELAKFEEITSEKRAASKKAAKDKETAKGAEGSPGKTSTAHSTSSNADEEGAGEDGETDTPPPAKKRKANGKAAPVNGTSAKSMKSTTIKTEVGDVNEEEDDQDEEEEEDVDEDFQEDEEEEEVYDEEEVQPPATVEEVVDDLEEGEPREDEALDNGYDSD